MTLKTSYKGKSPGILFSDIELNLVSYPKSYPCCVTVIGHNIDLLYIGNKIFKLVAIDDNVSTKLFINNEILVKGAKLKKIDCKHQEE